MLRNRVSAFSLVLLGVLWTQSSQAGLLVEPYLGYQVGGTFSNQFGAPSTYNNTAMGGRLGWEILLVQFGAEYMTYNHPMEPVGARNTTSKINGQALGAFAGVHIPLLALRLVGTYILDDESRVLELNSAGKEDSNFSYKGSGYKVGLWLGMLPFISIGFEYLSISSPKNKDNKVADVFGEKVGIADRQAAMVSLSLPLGW